MKGCALLAASLGLLVIGGCGGDGSSGGGSPKMEANISGLVNDQQGPVSHGQIEVKDASGAVVSKAEFHEGKYKVKVPASATYPVTLVAHPPQESVLNTPIRAVVTSSLADRMDISPVSEAIVDGALILGGLTAQNIAKASGGAIGMRQAQGVSASAGGSAGGPGNSGGGTGRGGHGGHNMDDMKRSTTATDAEAQPK